MSNPSVKPSVRTTVLAAAAGLVLLVLVLGFAVGLPEVSGDEGASTSELRDLPDELPGDLLSLTSPDVPAELVAQTGGPEQLAAVIDSADSNLDELFGAPAAFGIYGRVDGSALLTVTVGPGEPGLFVPDGAPVSADVQGVSRSDLDVVRVDDETVCSVLYSQSIAQGQPVDPAEQPARVHCQLASQGLLFDVTGQGLSVDEVVAAAQEARTAQER